ncbi:hypothetical protein TeGR_g5701, partial [Tetraparma gracilis]
MPPAPHLLALLLLPPTLALTYQNPLVPVADSPDPGCLYDTSSSLYVCATTDNGDTSTGAFNLHTSPNLSNWTSLADKAIPASAISSLWTDHNFWAPEIHASPFEDGRYLLVHTAAKPDGELCLGYAVSDSVTGPYEPADEPLLCYEGGTPGVGVIDCTVFVEGKDAYLVCVRLGGASGAERTERAGAKMCGRAH